MKPNLFSLIARIASKDRAAPLNQFVGCWVRRLDESWVIAVNAHSETLSCEPPSCMSVDVAPRSCAVWFNGWVAGSFDPYSGGLIADGALANEATLAKAMEEVLA